MAAKSNNQSDRDIWCRYTSGSDRALTELVEKYNGRLVAFLSTRKCKDPEGTCQEVWRKVIEKKASFDGESFSGWVFMIARNMLYEQHRKATRRDELNLSPEYDAASDEEIMALERMEQQEMVQIIQTCMETVGESFLAAFQMTLDGAKTKAIAKELGVAEGTVSSRVSRAKKSIKECVEGKTS